MPPAPDGAPPLDRVARRRLRAALSSAQPWLDDPEVGPLAVAAGTCDRCGDEPRLVAPCGPVPWQGLGRGCLLELGTEAFCPGHAADAEDLLDRARALPHDWATLVHLAWVASGEVRADTAFLVHAAATLRDPEVTAVLMAPDGADDSS